MNFTQKSKVAHLVFTGLLLSQNSFTHASNSENFNSMSKSIHASCGEITETFDTHTKSYVESFGAICLLSGGSPAKTVSVVTPDSLPQHTAEILEGGVGVWDVNALHVDARDQSLVQLEAAGPEESVFKVKVSAQVVGTLKSGYIENVKSMAWNVAHDGEVIGYYKANTLQLLKPMSEANYIVKLKQNAPANTCYQMLLAEVPLQKGSLAIIEKNEQRLKIAAGPRFAYWVKNGASHFTKSCVATIKEI